jgi:hypothetical protein
MSTLLVRVLFPNQTVASVSVQGTDTPRTLALSGPPLKSPVILLHKGRCLCPYTSLDSQGVINGDLVILHPMPVSRQRSKFRVASDPTAKLENDLEGHDKVFNEILRLADTAFLPYETSQFGSVAYEQMWKDEEEDYADGAAPPVPTRLVGPASAISTDPLPSCWEEMKSTRHKTARTIV